MKFGYVLEAREIDGLTHEVLSHHGFNRWDHSSGSGGWFSNSEFDHKALHDDLQGAGWKGGFQTKESEEVSMEDDDGDVDGIAHTTSREYHHPAHQTSLKVIHTHTEWDHYHPDEHRTDVYGGYKAVHENEVAVNAAGDGNVAGIGIGSSGEPGVPKNNKKKPLLMKGVLRRRVGNAVQ